MPQAISVRYARALVDAITAPNAGSAPAPAGTPGVAGQQALAELRAMNGMINGSADLRNVLFSPAVSNSKKRAVVARLGDSIPLSRLVRNFLYVIIDRRRAGILGDIAEAFELALDERMGVVRAEVKSAAPLTAAQQADLQQELSKLAGKQVRCEFSINPELIGGVVARIGSTLYDGSVRSQLQTLRERLVQR